MLLFRKGKQFVLSSVGEASLLSVLADFPKKLRLLSFLIHLSFYDFMCLARTNVLQSAMGEGGEQIFITLQSELFRQFNHLNLLIITELVF